MALTRRRSQIRFHRVSDWATRGEKEIAGELHRCEELAARAAHVLTGVRRQICLELVTAAAAHLLSLVDLRAKGSDAATSEELAAERKHLDEVERYYVEAANGQAQIVYFAGIGLFTILLGLFALFGEFIVSIGGVESSEFFGVLFAGAIGAVVSVVQRVNSGQFSLEYDVGRLYPFLLGGLRPAMGAVFGLGFYFAVASGLLEVIKIGEGTARLYALVVVAFVAGFSERWAKDTLATAAGAGKPASEVSPPRPSPSA